MNAPFRSPASLLRTDRQFFRKLISSFRHGAYKRPYGTIEHLASEAAERLDMAAEIRAAKEATTRRAAEQPIVLDDEEQFQRDEFLRRGQIGREIYHGGAL